MQSKRVLRVLLYEFSLMHLHGFLTALPQPCLSLVNAASASVS